MHLNKDINNLIFSYCSLYNKYHDLVNDELLKYINQTDDDDDSYIDWELVALCFIHIFFNNSFIK